VSSGTPTVRTFLIADVRGYTRFTRQRGDDAAAALATRFAELMGEVVREHQGTLEVTGDEGLAVFDSARTALRCAVALQNRFDDGFELGVGMGLDAGEAVPVQGGFRGTALNLASRLCAEAGPGEILASQGVVHLASHLDGIAYAGRRVFRLKGYQEPVRAVEVVSAERAPGRSRRVGARLRRRPALRRGLVVAVLGTLLVAGAVAAAVVLLTGGGEAALAAPPPSSVVEIDPASNKPVRQIPVGSNPSTIAVGEGAVWVLSADDQTISRVDPKSMAAKPFSVGTTPLTVAAGDGAVWIGNGTLDGAPVPVLSSVSRVDPVTLGAESKSTLPGRGRGGTSENSLAVGSSGAWVIDPDQRVSRLDPATGKVVATVPTSSVDSIAMGPSGDVWGLSFTPDPAVVRIHPRSARPIKIPSSDLADIAVGAGSVWVSSPEDGSIWRVDPGPQVRLRTIAVTKGVSSLAFGEGSLWAVNSLKGTVSRIDPKTNLVSRTIQIEGTPRDVAVGRSRVWVSNAGASCGAVVYGGSGRPQFLVVSDLPLRAGAGFPAAAMSRAVERVFRSHGFRAGKYTVGYQSCDDATSQVGLFDVPKCAANAKSYAAGASVIGVIGSYNSGCAFNQIPFLDTAPNGPLAMVSPSNSNIGLTRTDPLAPRDQLASLYPTGKRNFARVSPADDANGAAVAIFMKSLGISKAYLLVERQLGSYPEPLARAFRSTARKEGLELVGSGDFDAEASDYAALAGRIRRSGARAVFVAGLLGELGSGLAGLHASLGPHVKIVASQGSASIADVFRRLGPAARDIYVSYLGVTNERLPPAGRRFVSAFQRSQGGGPVHPMAAYAAQAAEVMLDAISRSDGTRPSVTKALFATHVRDGILGTFSFDRNGDTSAQQVTILKPARAGGSNEVGSPDGATVIRVVDVPPSLLR
jgi:branched-chain amino acid transport system substrate-binding protein